MLKSEFIKSVKNTVYTVELVYSCGIDAFEIEREIDFKLTTDGVLNLIENLDLDNEFHLKLNDLGDAEYDSDAEDRFDSIMNHKLKDSNDVVAFINMCEPEIY